MCTTCVDRLFDSGPAQCPYPGCFKTLRKKQFHEAFFGDLTIEREVDIRRRVAQVFNKREEDFETLDDYNRYLEDVEDLIFQLVQGNDMDRTKAEARLLDWERQHKEEIETVRRARGDEKEMKRLMLEKEKEEARRRREMMDREEEEERQYKQQFNEQLISALQNSSSAQDAEKEVNKIILKKRGRQNQATPVAATPRLGAGEANLSIRGLKKPATAADRLRARGKLGPYSPFQGVRLYPQRYPALEDKGVYHHIDLERYMHYDEFRVPGFATSEFYKRTMFDAFGGLGLEIGEDNLSDADALQGETSNIPVKVKT